MSHQYLRTDLMSQGYVHIRYEDRNLKHCRCDDPELGDWGWVTCV